MTRKGVLLGFFVVTLLGAACKATPESHSPAQGQPLAHQLAEPVSDPDPMICPALKMRLQALEYPLRPADFWNEIGLAAEPEAGLKSLSGSSGYWSVGASYDDLAEGCSLYVLEQGWEDEEFLVTEAMLDRQIMKTSNDAGGPSAAHDETPIKSRVRP